ncbi:MAG: hypothetical protein VX726_07510 [Planctomycetota bacterium]|nr:hypothetical protein [Planctomycetota bacterium]MEE2895575.1 hypothetical protein [Planctomycetota bacterium]
MSESPDPLELPGTAWWSEFREALLEDDVVEALGRNRVEGVLDGVRRLAAGSSAEGRLDELEARIARIEARLDGIADRPSGD